MQAAAELDRELQEERDLRHREQSINRSKTESLDKAHAEARLVRTDLEVLQAAVRGLTGKEGTVAEMVSALADVGRSKDVAMVAALRRDRDDALRREARAVDTLVAARELFIALRAAVQSERSWAASLPGWERLARALRGEKVSQEPESKPAHVAGPWIEIGPGEWRRRIEGSPLVFAASIGPHPDDPKVLVWCAWRPGGGTFAERNTALDLQAAKDACDAALLRAGWTLLYPTPAKDPQTVAIEAVAATVESVSEHVAALKQQIAGLGNGLDEVRDPAWFAVRFREHMTRHGFASVSATIGAEERPRVSWRSADGTTSGWLTMETGEQIAGAHEGNGGWYWWAHVPQGESTGNVGPMTKRAAIESAEAAARIRGAVVVR
jgi:hypothetical protein